MFLSRKALLEKNGALQREVNLLRNRLAELEEKQRKTPENCTPGEWCKACENAYVEYSGSPFGGFKIATCTLDRCSKFSRSSAQLTYPNNILSMLHSKEGSEK